MPFLQPVSSLVWLTQLCEPAGHREKTGQRDSEGHMGEKLFCFGPHQFFNNKMCLCVRTMYLQTMSKTFWLLNGMNFWNLWDSNTDYFSFLRNVSINIEIWVKYSLWPVMNLGGGKSSKKHFLGYQPECTFCLLIHTSFSYFLIREYKTLFVFNI